MTSRFFSDRFRRQEVINKLAKNPHTEKEQKTWEVLQQQVQHRSLLQAPQHLEDKKKTAKCSKTYPPDKQGIGV